MKSAKQATLELLERLPEDATFEEIHYRLYLLEKVGCGRADVLGGRVLGQQDLERRLCRLLGG